MSPLHQASYDAHELMIQELISDDLTELLSSRQSYAEMQDHAGERSWIELSSWSRIVRWYVGSQVLVLERNLTPAPREAGLAKVIAYVGKNAAQLVELNRDWAGTTASLRANLGRAAPERFSKEESDRDLEILNEVRLAIGPYRLRAGHRWETLFEKKCRECGELDAAGFTLPVFEELDFAINTLLDLVVKYAELMLGTPHHAFEVGFSLTDSGRMATIAKEWRTALADESQGDNFGSATDLNFTPIHLPT